MIVAEPMLTYMHSRKSGLATSTNQANFLGQHLSVVLEVGASICLLAVCIRVMLWPGVMLYKLACRIARCASLVRHSSIAQSAAERLACVTQQSWKLIMLSAGLCQGYLDSIADKCCCCSCGVLVVSGISCICPTAPAWTCTAPMIWTGMHEIKDLQKGLAKNRHITKLTCDSCFNCRIDVHAPQLTSLNLQACYSVEHVRLYPKEGPPCNINLLNANIDKLSVLHLQQHARVGLERMGGDREED